MSQEEQLLELLRKLDPAKDTTADDKSGKASVINPQTNVPSATMDPAPDAGKAGAEATSNVTANKLGQQASTGTATRRGGSVAQNEYARNAELANPTINKDNIRDSRWENWNNRSYNDTVNLARLANAFNSQKTWFAPSLVPMSRGGEGGGVRINAEQNPQLNTLEQQATGMYANQANQRTMDELARQNRSLNLPISIEEAVAKGVVDQGIAKDMADLGLSKQMMQDIWNNMYNKEYSQNLTERIQQYIADLQQQEIGENGQRLLAMFAQNPTLAVITAQQYGTQMPSFETWIQNGYIADQLGKQGINPYSMDAINWFDTTKLLMSMQHLNNVTAGAAGMIGAGIFGVNPTTKNGGLFAPSN